MTQQQNNHYNTIDANNNKGSKQEVNQSFSKTIKLPRQFYNSRTSVIKWIKQQQNSNNKGTGCFWVFLLTYMQIQHYDIFFTKQQLRMREMLIIKSQQQLITNADNEQQRSQDALSISNSSVHMRERKVSFGLIKPVAVENQRRKRRGNISGNNMFVNNISSGGESKNVNNKDELEQQLRRLKQRWGRLKQLLRKVRILVYEYAQKIDLQQQRSIDHNNKHQQQQQKSSSLPGQILKKQSLSITLSMSVVKALSILFPKQQSTTMKDINQAINNNTYYHQHHHIELFVQLLGRKQSNQTSHVNNLLRVLEYSSNQKIITNKQLLMTITDNHQSRIINNVQTLLKYFNFNQQTDYKLIHTQNNISSLNTISSQQCQFKQLQPTIKGISILNGFFNIIGGVNNGSMMAIDIQKCTWIRNDKLKNIINKSILFNTKPITKNVTLLTNQQQQQNKQQQHNQINSNNISSLPYCTQAHQTTSPQQFITRYNNRYFKNQRLLYKQRTKLQGRFKQQQTDHIFLFNNHQFIQNHNDNRNIDIDIDIRYIDNRSDNNNSLRQQYSNGYEISVNNSSKVNDVHNNNNTSGKQQQQQQNCYQYHQYNNKSENNMNEYNLQTLINQQPTQLNDQINNLLFDDDQTIKQQQQQQQYIYQQQNHQTNNRQQNHQPNNRQQQTLINLYSRYDFEISDNQILDDIERVLI